MEEKERYKYSEELNGVYDSEAMIFYNWYLNEDKIVALLNQQDKHIKELEEQLSTTEKMRLENLNEGCRCVERDMDRIIKLQQENQQLKQSQNKNTIELLEKVKNYFNDKEDNDYDESEGWIITNRCVVEYVDSLIKKLKE